MTDLNNHDADPILVTRRADARVFVLAVVLPLFTMLPGVVAIESVRDLIWPRHPLTRDDYINTAIAVGVAAIFIWISFYFVRMALTKAVFRTQSAQLVTLGRVRRTMRYGECERFTYRRQRNYKYGVWVGTYFKVKLAAKGMKPVALGGRHKERATLAGSSFLNKEFKGSDDIDLLPAHVGAIMADAWEDRLAAGERLRWSGYTLTNEGIIPRFGPHRGQCVGFDRVYLKARDIESFDLYIGTKRDATRMSTGAVNFWPGAILIERLGTLGDSAGDDPEHGDGQEDDAHHADEGDLD